MNRQIVRVGGVAMGLLVVLIVATTYWQTWARPGLAERQDNAIQRVAQFQIKRGLILSPSRVLARNRERVVNGKTFYLRTYPQGRLTAHVVGYSTAARSRTGSRTVAQRRPHRLRTEPLVPRRPVTRQAQRQADHRRQRRDDDRSQRPAGGTRRARLSVRCRRGARSAQRQGSRNGLVAQLRPERRGDNFGRIERITASCKPASPLLNRATQGLYPPGSTFKVVTASAALESKQYTPTSGFVDPGYCTVYGKRVNNFDTERPFGSITLATALQYSVNSVFCNIGLKLGAKRIVKQAKKFGFYDRPPLETPDSERLPSGLYRRGKLFDPKRDSDVDAGRMAFGQERLLVTPLQMAMVAGTIGNGGILMRPNVVDPSSLPTARRSSGRGRRRSAAPSPREPPAT